MEYGGVKTKINPLVVWARLSATLRHQISLCVAIFMDGLGIDGLFNENMLPFFAMTLKARYRVGLCQ